YANDLATVLRNRSVGVAVLNGCDTGTSSVNDGLSGVAGAIINAGVPAAIATMRAIPDEAALLFTRELYRAMLDSDTLEAAVVEARKALSLQRWNWSAYSLFSGRTDLNALRLLAQAERKVTAPPSGSPVK